MLDRTPDQERAAVVAKGLTIAERNEGYTPPHFDMAGGVLGTTPILWEIRMAYPWDEQLEGEREDWDQCCTCWVFAVSESEARGKVWRRFTPPSVMPEAIASCYPKRFRNERDDAIERGEHLRGGE